MAFRSAPARALTVAVRMEGVSLGNNEIVHFEFVGEALTARESMLFGMFACNIYAPLPWYLAVETFCSVLQASAEQGRAAYSG